MANSVDTFILSLDGAEPPAFATPLLRAVWHGLHGEWDAAHRMTDAHDDAQGAWVHAWLHRIEGDLANAAYWYQRAGRAMRHDATRDEGLEIAGALIGSVQG